MSTRGMFRMQRVTPFNTGLMPIDTIRIGEFSESGPRTPGKIDAQRKCPKDVCIYLVLLLLVVIIYPTIMVVSEVTSSIATLRDTARPFMVEMVNHTMSILSHADNSMVDVNDMADGAVGITNQALPAMQLALNQTSTMITRLEALAQHPVLQLSLAQGQVGPV